MPQQELNQLIVLRTPVIAEIDDRAKALFQKNNRDVDIQRQNDVIRCTNNGAYLIANADKNKASQQKDKFGQFTFQNGDPVQTYQNISNQIQTEIDKPQPQPQPIIQPTQRRLSFDNISEHGDAGNHTMHVENIRSTPITKIINGTKVGLGQVAEEIAKGFQSQEKDKELHNLAVRILQNTLDALQSQGITQEDMQLFIKKMQEQIDKHLYAGTSIGSEGKNAGFTAWEDAIKVSLQDDERGVEERMKIFQTISAEIQKQTKNMLHTRVGRKYDSGEFMMRSYRLIQLLDKDKSGKSIIF